MKHDWRQYEDKGPANRHRLCLNCGAEQKYVERKPRLQRKLYHWTPLVGRCLPVKKSEAYPPEVR